MMAARLGIPLHEIEINPDVVELLPRVVDILDEPIGDPAAINTLLICESARAAGVKVLLSGMGADELFGGYRKHLACLYASRYQRVPAPARRAVAGLVDRLPVIAGSRGIRSVRWAQRFLSFAELGEEQAFRRSYTMYDPDELTALLDPGWGGHVDTLVASAPRHLRGQRPRRSAGPHVPGRQPAVHGRPEPRVHRPVQHGGLVRGPRAVRRPAGLRGGVLARRERPDPWPGPEGRVEGRRPALAPRRDHRPAQGVVRRAAARVGQPGPERSSSTTCSSAASWSRAACCAASRWSAWSPTSEPGGATTPSRYGSC